MRSDPDQPYAHKIRKQRRALPGASAVGVHTVNKSAPGALTPAGLMEALSPYVDFGAGGATVAPASAPAAAPPGSIGALRKGLTVIQVEQILGPAAKVSQRPEGSMEVSVREYSTADGQQVATKFVGGVLVDYTITPRG